MAKSTIHVGLEIGTAKVCVVVGEVRGDGAIRILGVGQAASCGVRKGEIVDFDKARTCVHDALVRAEDRSDVMIRNVFLAVTGPHVESLNNRGCIRIEEDQNEITYDDLADVKEIARDVPIPPDNVYLHSIIRHYYVDGGERVLNPVGMLGSRLEADYHIIHGMRARIQNAIRCVREIPLEVEDVVFGPVAAAQVLLSRANKENGALVVDMGAGTTDYLLYTDGSVAQSGSIGLGGDHVTNDVSVVLKLPLSRAEWLKKEWGSVALEPSHEGEMVEVEDAARYTGTRVDRGLLTEVMHMRVRETFEQLRDRLEEGGFAGRVSDGVFLCGGASLTDGVAQLAEEVLELPVQRPSSAPVSGLTATFENPQYSVPIGLIRYAQILENERPRRGALSKVGQRISSLFGSARHAG